MLSNKPLHLQNRFLLTLSLALLFILTQCKNKDQPEFVFNASLLVNEDHTWFQAFIYFDSLLQARTEGRISVQVYPSEQLAKEVEAIRMIQAGVIDMTTTGSTLNNWIEIASFCELPFLLKDTVEMQKLIHGPVGKRIELEMLEKTGLRPLAYFQRGARHLTSNRPIRHPDDLKGLIVRVPNVPSFVTAWSALGAKPTPMAFSEVFTALQQGTIQAQENPFPLIRSAGFAEVQRYINLTAHVISWVYPVIGERQFQQLPEDLKDIFLKSAYDMKVYEHQLFMQGQQQIILELKERGMEFIEVDNEPFKEKCREAIFQSLSPEMQEIYHQILDS